MKDYLKRVLASACVCFTVLTFLYAAIVYALYGGSGDGGLLSSFRILMFFVFALLFSCGNGLLKTDKLAFWMRILAHAILTCLGFYLCLILPAEMKGGSALMGMLIFMFVYAVIAAVILLNRAQAKKRENKEAEYHSVYSGKNSK